MHPLPDPFLATSAKDVIKLPHKNRTPDFCKKEIEEIEISVAVM
jgi:hypothetical protein